MIRPTKRAARGSSVLTGPKTGPFVTKRQPRAGLSRCAGPPRPPRARSLDAGRSPGLRVMAVAIRLLARLGQWHVDRSSPPTVAGAAAFARSRRAVAFPFQPLRATGICLHTNEASRAKEAKRPVMRWFARMTSPGIIGLRNQQRLGTYALRLNSRRLLLIWLRSDTPKN